MERAGILQFHAVEAGDVGIGFITDKIKGWIQEKRIMKDSIGEYRFDKTTGSYQVKIIRGSEEIKKYLDRLPTAEPPKSLHIFAETVRKLREIDAQENAAYMNGYSR